MHACYHVTIWVLRDSVHHLKTMHRVPSHVTNCLCCRCIDFCFILLIQSVLVSAKWAKLREIVAKVEEEEPEDEAVAGPSDEATIHSCGITPSLLSFLLLLIYAYTYAYCFSQHLLAAHFTPEFLPFFLAYESTDEEISRPRTKEEEDVDTLQSWVQVGGFLLIWRRRCGGLLLEVSLFSSPSFWFLCGFLLISYIPSPVLFALLGIGSTEKGGHPMEGNPEIRNGGTTFGG